MAKFKVTFHETSLKDPKDLGTYNTIEAAAEHGWDYAYEHGYTRSSCENHESVIAALVARQYCMLGYGPSDVEIEEIAD